MAFGYEMQGAARSRRAATGVALGIAALGFLAAGAILMDAAAREGLALSPSGGRYMTVVAKVRSLHLPPGARRRFRLAGPSDPAILREDMSRYGPLIGQGAGTVWAEKDAAGRLLVAIETMDHGHAGELGYVYADAGALGGEKQGSSVEGPGREWTLDRYWGEGWWSVSYRLG
jgi:hypothetical protein